MGKAERDKGARGERELVNLAKAQGLRARRTAGMQAADASWGDIDLPDWYEALHVECKRDNHMSVDRMVRQAEEATAYGPSLVCWRRDGGNWYSAVPTEWLFDLMRYCLTLGDPCLD